MRALLDNPIPIEEVEDELKHQPTIRIDGYGVEEGLSLKQFILRFISDLNPAHTTSEDGQNITPQNKHRSVGDIFRICLTYYPDATLLEVNDILNELWAEDNIKTLFCGNIEKRVFFQKDFTAHGSDLYSDDPEISGLHWYSAAKNGQVNEYGWKHRKDYFNYKK